jgi:hypothetical protein
MSWGDLVEYQINYTLEEPPRITLIRIAMIANTRRICINPPALYPINPIAQAIISTTAIM